MLKLLISSFSNIRTGTQQIDFDRDVTCVPDKCLQEDYRAALYFGGNPLLNKFWTFLACRNRQDDHRMRVYKRVEGEGTTRFLSRYLNVVERSLLMGFPANHVEEALKVLFAELSYAHS